MISRKTGYGLLPFFVDVAFFAAVWIFISGGLFFRSGSGQSKVLISVSQWGLYLMPLLFLLRLAPDFRAKSLAVTLLSVLRKALLSLSNARQTTLLFILLLVPVMYHFFAMLNKYLSFHSGLDLAIYSNACHNYLFSSIKGDVSILADHFAPVLGLFSPLCNLVDPPVALLTVQALAWYLGAIGVFYLARALKWSVGLSWLVAFVYVMFPGNFVFATYDFHPIGLTIGLMPWIWFSIARGRWLSFWLLMALFLGLKETTWLTGAGIGLFLIFTPKSETDRKRKVFNGLVLVVLGLVGFVLIMQVVTPHFSDGQSTMYFSKYFAKLGNNMGEFLETIFTRPAYSISILFAPVKLSYLVQIFGAFLFFHFLRFRYLLPVCTSLLINVASDLMISGRYHYEADIYPTLFVSIVFLFSDTKFSLRVKYILKPLRQLADSVAKRLSSPLLKSAISIVYRPLSPRTLWLAIAIIFLSGTPPGWNTDKYRPNKYHFFVESKLKELIPKDAKVAANQKIAPHLTNREFLYLFDYTGMEEDWQRADFIAIADPVAGMAWESVESEWGPRFAADFVLIFRHRKYPLLVWKRR